MPSGIAIITMAITCMDTMAITGTVITTTAIAFTVTTRIGTGEGITATTAGGPGTAGRDSMSAARGLVSVTGGDLSQFG